MVPSLFGTGFWKDFFSSWRKNRIVQYLSLRKERCFFVSSSPYVMKISRLTVDKLGVRLYDKVSAVIAELVANSYDADATEVLVKAPMGKLLATKHGDEIIDSGYFIE